MVRPRTLLPRVQSILEMALGMKVIKSEKSVRYQCFDAILKWSTRCLLELSVAHAIHILMSGPGFGLPILFSQNEGDIL